MDAQRLSGEAIAFLRRAEAQGKLSHEEVEELLSGRRRDELQVLTDVRTGAVRAITIGDRIVEADPEV